MKVELYQGQDHPQLSIVTKLLRYESGNPIVRSHDNPNIDYRLSEVEFSDGEKMSLSANTIVENIFSQVDEHGYRYVIMDEIIDLCTDGTQVSKGDAFVTLKYGAKRSKDITKGW